MKRTMMVILLCGLISLAWGYPLWAAAGTAPSSSPSTPSAFTPQGNVKPAGSISDLFRKGPVGLSAATIPGPVFEAKQDPATGDVQITFRLEKSGPVEVTVTDAKGQPVWDRVYSIPFAGLCRVVWDGKGTDSKVVFGSAGLKPVSSGVYTLKITSPDGVKTTQFSYQPLSGGTERTVLSRGITPGSIPTTSRPTNSVPLNSR